MRAGSWLGRSGSSLSRQLDEARRPGASSLPGRVVGGGRGGVIEGEADKKSESKRRQGERRDKGVIRERTAQSQSV